MTRLTRSTLAGLAAILLLTALTACQSGAPQADQGLIPAMGSTGNPPLIPHEIDPAEGGATCLECHRTGEAGAPKVPDWHATLVDCGQCHVPAGQPIAPFAPRY